MRAVGINAARGALHLFPPIMWRRMHLPNPFTRTSSLHRVLCWLCGVVSVCECRWAARAAGAGRGVRGPSPAAAVGRSGLWRWRVQLGTLFRQVGPQAPAMLPSLSFFPHPPAPPPSPRSSPFPLRLPLPPAPPTSPDALLPPLFPYPYPPFSLLPSLHPTPPCSPIPPSPPYSLHAPAPTHRSLAHCREKGAVVMEAVGGGSCATH